MNFDIVKKVRVPRVVTGNLSRQSLILKKHSPNILFVGGLVGITATVVLACKATLKVETVLNDTELDRENARELLLRNASYTEKDFQRDMRHIYIKNARGIVRLYAPPTILGVTSIAALTGSHKMLTSRNAGLTAAYAIIEKSFGDYRARVIDDIGEAKDREYRFGTEEVSEVKQGKNGPKTVKKNAIVAPNGKSDYARVFDEYNPNWKTDPEYNAIFLRQQQNWANDRLHARRHVLLNDVYDMLGMERTSAGCVVGWTIGKDGDNFIDFGVFEDGGLKMKDFHNYRNEAVVLDFNVDGLVYDKI